MYDQEHSALPSQPTVATAKVVSVNIPLPQLLDMEI